MSDLSLCVLSVLCVPTNHKLFKSEKEQSETSVFVKSAMKSGGFQVSHIRGVLH